MNGKKVPGSDNFSSEVMKLVRKYKLFLLLSMLNIFSKADFSCAQIGRAHV